MSGLLIVCLLRVGPEPHCSGHRGNRVEKLGYQFPILPALPPERRWPLRSVVPEVA
jgi:hypothetical protein